ncbi:MAG: hypothetical protein AB1646_17335 [Thermodesulfobacteriota bacterium]
MLIEAYHLEVEVSAHSGRAFEYEAVARLPVDISLVLPYLNASLKNGNAHLGGQGLLLLRFDVSVRANDVEDE